MLPGRPSAQGADGSPPMDKACPGPGERPLSFSLEAIVRRSYNYLERLVDAEGLPYFNVFCTEPAEAAHDWPDFGDVTARQLQAAIMARLMTGRRCAHEDRWRARLLSYVDARTGIYTRPRTPYSQPDDYLLCLGDRALLLYALATAYAEDQDERLRTTMVAMVDRMATEAASGELLGHGWITGFLIKSVTTCGRLLGYEPAFALAQQLVTHLFGTHPIFGNGAQWPAGAHMHGHLRTLLGAADYALYAGDEELFGQIEELFRAACTKGTRFGFLPEVVDRRGDIIACETCALMDSVGLGVTLARHGFPQYWAEVERTVRNHLVESQITEVSWLHGDPTRADTAQFSWHAIGERVVGAFAGWSSPTHILACHETLPWGGPELRGKPRALQNCCAGSGVHALYIAWKHAASFADDCLTVNLHFDKLLPEAEIRCHQPHNGFLTVKLKKPCRLTVRLPEGVQPAQMVISVNDTPVEGTNTGGYLKLEGLSAGDQVTLEYPLPLVEEEVAIGNPGFRTYHYRVRWKGATVVSMEPLGREWTTGYSELEQREVPIFYGRQGPCALYQRSHLLPMTWARPALLHCDESPVDHWSL